MFICITKSLLQILLTNITYFLPDYETVSGHKECNTWNLNYGVAYSNMW